MALRRPVLSQALALLAALLLTACMSEAGPSLTAPAVEDQVKAGNLTLIDVRTPAEWRQTGIAVGAKRINMSNPKGPDGFAEAVLAQVGGNRDAPIALICRTGNRSGAMQEALGARGFSRVYNVTEGMAGSGGGPGWIKRGLPIEPCKDC